MAKLRRKNIKLGSIIKQSNIKPCYVLVDKYQLNDEKQSNNETDNIIQEQNLKNLHDLDEVNKNLIRKCRVNLIRITPTQSIRTLRGHSSVNGNVTTNFLGKPNVNTETEVHQNSRDIKLQNFTNKFNRSNKDKVINNINKTITNNFMEENDENQSNITKRTRRNKKISTINELINVKNDKLNTNPKTVLSNAEQNEVNHMYEESNIITRRRKTILVDSEKKSVSPHLKINDKQDSIKSNKVITRSDNTNKKVEKDKLNNIFKNTSEQIINETTPNNAIIDTNTDQQNSEEIANMTNCNSTTIESITTQQNEVHPINRGNNMITRSRKIGFVAPKKKSDLKNFKNDDKQEPIKRNKIVTRGANTTKKVENDKLNNILKNNTVQINNETTPSNVIIDTNTDQQNSEEIENMSNCNSIPIKSIATQNEIYPINRGNNMITRSRKIGFVAPKKKSDLKKFKNDDKEEPIKRNKIVTRGANTTNKVENDKLNNILKNNTKQIINRRNPNNAITDTSSNQQNPEEMENTKNYNSIKIESITTPEIQKETFFRGLRSNKMSNTNKFKFELEKNIQTKQEPQKNRKKNPKIKSQKSEVLLFSSAMENQTKGKTKNNKGIDKDAENIENLDIINANENLTESSRMKTKNNRRIKIKDKKINQDGLDKLTDKTNDLSNINRNNTAYLTKNDSKDKNLSVSDISAILEEDTDDNLNSNQITPKKIFKSPLESRKVIVENPNNSKIFDFQSSQSDSDFSPNKIIDEKNFIKKLLKEGKVQVAKYKKGRGRLILKRAKKEKSTITRKQRELNLNKTDKNTEKGNQIEHGFKHDHHSFENDHIGVKVSFSPEQKQIGYSPLARSAMNMASVKNIIKNTGENKQRERVVDKKKLLEAAKGFLNRISNIKKKNYNVPLQRKTNSINNMTLIRTPPTFNASTPWRSPDLVRNFNYNLSPKNLSSKLQQTIPSNYSQSENLQSTNLSNIENLQPENKNKIIETNPRKGLTNRSPLKNINILEVINLPPLALESLNKYKTNTPNIEDVSPNDNKPENNSIADIFNLEDVDADTENNNCELVIPKKRNLKDKLKKLKRLLPKKDTDTLSKPSRISVDAIKKIYKTNSPVKQKNIKEMFCSTMLNENTQKELEFTRENPNEIIEEGSDESTKENNNKNDSELHLFDDLAEPSSFSLNSTVRTYTRPKKCKKMRHEFITCMSSESEDEEETDENVQKKRTKKTDEKKNEVQEEALSKFYTEFNSVTGDVDKYELMMVPETE